MVVPTFSRGLLAAAQARPTTGSITGPVSTSESQRESNPRSSRPLTSSASASGLDAAPAAPTPMRIFMSAPFAFLVGGGGHRHDDSTASRDPAGPVNGISGMIPSHLIDG